MPGFGSAHWGYILILLVIVLIIWGPGKLPDIGAGMGRAIREFKKASQDVRDNVVNAAAEPPRDERRAPEPSAPEGEEHRTPA